MTEHRANRVVHCSACKERRDPAPVPCQNSYSDDGCQSLVVKDGHSVYCCRCEEKNRGRRLATASRP